MTGTSDLFLKEGFTRLPLTMQQRQEKLSSFSLTREAGSEAASLAQYIYVYRVGAGTTVFKEHDTNNFLCLIVHGRLKIVRESDDRMRTVIACLGSGDMVGELALLDGLPRSATAVAMDDTTMFIITRMNFLRIADEHPQLFGWLVETIARRICQRLRQANEVLTHA